MSTKYAHWNLIGRNVTECGFAQTMRLLRSDMIRRTGSNNEHEHKPAETEKKDERERARAKKIRRLLCMYHCQGGPAGGSLSVVPPTRLCMPTPQWYFSVRHNKIMVINIIYSTFELVIYRRQRVIHFAEHFLFFFSCALQLFSHIFIIVVLLQELMLGLGCSFCLHFRNSDTFKVLQLV